LGLKTPPQRVVANKLFIQIAEAARNPVFYEAYHVPDTVEGRFDMIVLHMVPALERMRPHDSDGLYGQALFDAMVSNLDDNLREMGVGDTRVGKRVREFAEVFYGRAKVYREALEADDQAALTDAVGRNVYGDPVAPHAAALADYLRESAQMGEDDLESLQTGQLAFPDPTERITP
ncbi:MAG: ubiquinol-cytochrome C chaperone family protein, partial [Pseudomonadota bacterium]